MSDTGIQDLQDAARQWRVGVGMMNLVGAGPAAPCHLCDRPTTHVGHFDAYAAPDLPMCRRCMSTARAGDRRFWWR